MDILKNKWVTGGIMAVILLGLVYYVWTSAAATPLLSGGEPGTTSPLSREILTSLGQLRTINLDPAVFVDPVFVSLSDFGVTIPPQNVGRRNPFAPVSVVGSVVGPGTPAGAIPAKAR